MKERLNAPYDGTSYQGTHVKVLPNDSYYKKLWNKKHYVERETDLDGKPRFYLKTAIDGDGGWYGSVFCLDAVEHIHFEYIKGNKIYNSIGVVVGEID